MNEEFNLYLEKYSKKHKISEEVASEHQICKDAKEYFNSKPKKKEEVPNGERKLPCDS